MRKLTSMIASVLCGFATFAGATTIDNSSIFEVEVNGHFVDGYHEVVKAVKDGDSYKVIALKGSYDWADGQLKYTTSIVGDNLDCVSESSLNAKTLLCSKNEMPVDGIRLVIEFSCQLDQQQGCSVTQTTSAHSWTTGEIVTERTVLLKNAELVSSN